MAISGLPRLQGKRPAAVFYPFGHPTPYTYGKSKTLRKSMQNYFWFLFYKQLQFCITPCKLVLLPNTAIFSLQHGVSKGVSRLPAL
jgi:hypothetical protein